MLLSFAVLVLTAWVLTGREADLLVEGNRLTVRYRHLGFLLPGRRRYDLAGGSVGFIRRHLVLAPKTGKSGRLAIPEGLGPWLVRQLGPALQHAALEEHEASAALRRLVSGARTPIDPR